MGTCRDFRLILADQIGILIGGWSASTGDLMITDRGLAPGEMIGDPEELDAMFGPEDLNPELEGYIERRDRIGFVLHHPLIIQVMYTPIFNKRINRMYAYKQERLARAVEEQDWGKFIFLHERPYRLDALHRVLFEHKADDPAIVWGLVSDAWIDCENVYQNLSTWRKIWSLPISDREQHVMDEAERAALEALPDTIQVYRGHAHKKSQKGMSWTTDRDRAIWFAKRFAGVERRKVLLSKGIVSKQHVFALLLGRGENEIVSNKVKQIEYGDIE